MSHMQSDIPLSHFSAYNIEKLGVAWGRCYNIGKGVASVQMSSHTTNNLGQKSGFSEHVRVAKIVQYLLQTYMQCVYGLLRRW